MANVKTYTVDMDNAKQVRDAHAALEKRLWELERDCEHQCVPSNPKDKDCSHPVCTKCGQHLPGWFCPDSPNGICDYDHPEEDGGYNPDSCRYCGQPDERK